MPGADSISLVFRSVPSATASFWVSVLGFLGTTAGLFFAGYQFSRAQKWKRSEFVATKIGEFEATPAVRNVLQMIDWSSRRVNLANDAKLPKDKWPLVTRAALWRALLPHTIKEESPDWADQFGRSQSEEPRRTPAEERKGRFSDQEVLIRDSFDTFLDHLDRFGGFCNTKLVPPRAFSPYLEYWIDDLATRQGTGDGAKWRCVLMVYVQFYRFSGVQRLFHGFGYDIRPGSALFDGFCADMQDETLAKALLSQVRGQGEDQSYLASVGSDDDPEIESMAPVPAQA